MINSSSHFSNFSEKDVRLYPYKATILHVTEALNGGIHTALVHIIKSHPDCLHVLLSDSHPWDPLSPLEDFNLAGVIKIPWKSPSYKRIIHLRQVIAQFQPNIIHLHSSWAGFYGRILPSEKEIYYSPHAFAFQRRDISLISRSIYFLIELILQLNTTQNISFWPIEHRLFKWLTLFKKNIFSPILIAGTLQKEMRLEPLSEAFVLPRIVCVARISPQKDPKFFIDTVQIIRKFRKVEVFWIGGGTSKERRDLENAQVQIVEWLSQDSVANFLRSSSLLLVTSAWESGPLTVYESLSFGTPVVWRNIPANGFLGWNHGNTSEEVALTVLNFLEMNKADLCTSQLTSVKAGIEQIRARSW